MNAAKKRNLGKVLFVVGLLVLLLSWTVEQTVTRNYETRVDEMRKAIAELRASNLELLIQRVLVDVARFQNVSRQVELLKQLQADLPEEKRKSGQELLQRFTRKHGVNMGSSPPLALNGRETG